jgi:hypothetical protein
MIDCRVRGQELLKEWQLYKTARPREHVFDIQGDKEDLAARADLLQTVVMWDEDETRIEENCLQFESCLAVFKEKIVLELLTRGAA